MTNASTRKSLLIKIFAISLASLFISFASLVVYAYFATQMKIYTNDGQTQYVRMGMELNTFFDMIDKSNVSTGTALGIVCTDSSCATGTITQNAGIYTYNPNAPWGSASNPYIISRKSHLQNLYVLQNCGYFEQSISGCNEASLPYFLVCTNVGTPACIDCTGATIEPIGNEIYPFIGYLGGSFVTGTTKADGENGTRNSDQSVIYNATIKTDSDVIDIGLFGQIGFLKSESSTVTNNQFTGTVSTVSNLLLYDVTVKVDNPSPLASIATFLASHLFSFRDYNNLSSVIARTDTATPHEDHHIGILAGHVELATVEKISVYYSNTTIPALDVKYTSEAANFKSISGILGFCYEMNSEQANGVVTIGGISNDDIEVTGGGVGTGGGLVSGIGRGYVTAYDIMSNYQDSGQIVRCTITETITDNSDPQTPYTYTTSYYRYGLKIVFDSSNPLEYINSSNNTVTTYFSLSDGTTPVAIINTASNGYAWVARIFDTYNNFFGIQRTSSNDWNEFILYNKDNSTYYYYKEGAADSSGNPILVPITASTIVTTGISLRYAASYSTDSKSFTNLCTRFERDRIGSSISGWTQTTDRFYFYDGVFTFALSDSNDTVESTWNSATADSFLVGNDDAADWITNGTNGNKTVASYVKKINTVAELKSAANNNKKIFIMYEQSDGSMFLVTLNGNSTYTQGNGDDALFTFGTSLNFIDDATKASLIQSLNSGALSSPISGMTSSQLATYLADTSSGYNILSLGDTGNSISLSALNAKYPITVTFTNESSSSNTLDEYGNTFSGTNCTLTPGTGIVETNVPYIWDYFFSFETHDTGKTTYTHAWWYYTCKYYYYKITNSSASQPTEFKKSSTINASSSDWKQPWEISGVSSGNSTYGVNSYNVTGDNGVSIGPAPILYYQGGKYYSSWTRKNDNQVVYGSTEATFTNGKYVSYYTRNHNYFLATVTDTGTTYQWNGSESLSGTPIVYTDNNGNAQTTTFGGKTYTLYKLGDKIGILLTTTNTSGYFTFSKTDSSNVKYSLGLLRRAYLASYYSVMCGSSSYVSTGSNFTGGTTPSVSFTDQATVVSSGLSDNSFYISYTLRGNTRYLSYTTAGRVSGNEVCFHGSSSTDMANVQIYSVEGSQDINYGYATYEPKSGTGTTYSSSAYVLVPNQSYKSGDTSTSSYQPTEGATTTDPTYRIQNLSGLGFKNSKGSTLSYSDLQSVFHLKDKISDINILGLWGGESTINFNTEYVKAPVGTTGEEAYIPTGCVAFRVNEESTSNKIRVIVAVPQTDYYYDEIKNNTRVNPSALDYSEDYYFCMWYLGDTGSSNVTSISLSNCMEAFELPRSNTYAPGSTASDSECYPIITSNGTTISGSVTSDTSVKKFITIADSATAPSTTYKRSYLNGSVVLVAYEFSASKEGIYVLGSNKACQIVYFSADATAGQGDDGTGTYRMGTIDFVYDNGYNNTTPTKVINVTDQQYVPTNALLYTDNLNNGTDGPISGDTDIHSVSISVNQGGGTVTDSISYSNINNFSIYVRRTRNSVTSNGNTSYSQTLDWYASGTKKITNYVLDAAYIQFVRYSFSADTINRGNDVYVAPAS